jgi:DNA-binding SARP family transcriptional activator/class 3 adenylate cyclase
MEFRILGSLEVIDDGQALDLGGQKHRALLAALLLEANRVVSSDRLIEALWPEQPPGTARKALQVYVSQLRKSLGKERLETRAPGYRLRVHEGELDVERCRLLAAQGSPAEALALWRGAALSDFAYEPFAQAEIARLEALRLACLEDRLDVDLAAGRHAAVVGELESLVAEYPLRERFRAQLMLALYRSGRQAEALEVYRQGRGLLADELGLEPGEALKSLQRAILEQDPSLDLPAGQPAKPDAAPVSAPTAPADPRAVRKTVTVVVAAVEAADSGEAIDPEAQRRMAGRAFSEVAAAVEHHGGTVETLTGDALTAVFGVPFVHEDDAVRALRAVAAVRERTSSVCLGVSTGEVITGGPERGAVSTGRPITAAARLAQQAQAGEVLIDEPTHRLARELLDVEPHGQGLLLVGLRLDLPVARSRFDAPMVGRERERRRLDDTFEQAAGDRSCQLFTILGAAGVGKSRLVREFLRGVADDAMVVQGRCLPYGEGITYYPLLEAVREAAALEDADPADEAVAKIAALVDDPDADLVARRVGELIGLAKVGVGAHESFAAVRALFDSLARRRPLVIVFDDIHWGETTFLDLIEYLADWMRDAPALIVAMARPELLDVRPGWSGGKLNATSALLEPLSEAESETLVDSLAGADVQEETKQRIVTAAEGNPLFVEEMLALVLEDGRSDVEIEVPPTIQALLAARLDRLPADERSVIELAAVEGKEFYEDAVSELPPERLRPEVPAALGGLVRKELIRPDRLGLGGRTYRFRHLLIRDAAYDSIPKESRAAMHEAFGAWLERAAGDRTAEYEEVVGYHFEQAYRYRAEVGSLDEDAGELARKAAERLGAAGRRALLRSDVTAAANLLSRAVDLLGPEDPLRVELIPSVRKIQGLGDDLGWADDVLTAAVETAATTGDRRLAAHALLKRAFLRLFTGTGATSEELLGARDRGLPGARRRAWARPCRPPGRAGPLPRARRDGQRRGVGGGPAPRAHSGGRARASRARRVAPLRVRVRAPAGAGGDRAPRTACRPRRS